MYTDTRTERSMVVLYIPPPSYWWWLVSRKQGWAFAAIKGCVCERRSSPGVQAPPPSTPPPPSPLLLHLLLPTLSSPPPRFSLDCCCPLVLPSHKLGLAEDRMILWAWGTPWSSQARVTSVDSHLARKSSSFNSRFENSSSGKHDCSHRLLAANWCSVV